MLEVFIAYSNTTPIEKLRDTLVDWDSEEYEPIAILVKDISNDRLVRIAAEAIATNDYIVAALGTKPTSTKRVLKYKKGQGIRVQACQPRIQ